MATAVVPIGTRVGIRRAIIEEAGAADVVGRLGGDPEVKALVVEDHSHGGTELGGVQALDLNLDLLLFAEGELVNHHHLAQDPGHLENDRLRTSNVWESGHKDLGSVQDGHRLVVHLRLRDVDRELVAG